MPAPTGYTTVSGVNLCDSTGATISNATISFQPCDAQGVPISFSPNGAGQAIDTPVTTQVTAGAFSLPLADTTLTRPVNVGYLVTVVDNLSQKQLLGPGYIIQPSGPTWSFDSFQPNQAFPVVQYAAPSLAAAVNTRLPLPANLFNQATAISGAFVIAGTNVVQTNPFYAYSDYMPANSGGQMVSNIVASQGGYSFYDANFNFLSGFAEEPPGAAVTVPASAVFVRVSCPIASLGSAMVVNGTALPSTYQSFGTYAESVIDSKLAAAQLAAQTAALETLFTFFPGPINLFNPAAATENMLLPVSTGIAYADPEQPTHIVSGFIPVAPGATYTVSPAPLANSAYGLCWYDVNLNFLSGVGGPFTGTPNFTAPATASYVRFQSGPLATTVFNLGATPLTPYQPFPYLQSKTSAVAGENLAVWGDSISSNYANAWQNFVSARTGLFQAFQDARGGRATYQAFEAYGGTPYATFPNGAITSFSIAANVITFAGSALPVLPAGTVFTVFGLSVGTYLNNSAGATILFTAQAGASSTAIAATAVTGLTATAFTHANVSSTADAGTLVTPGHNFGGVAISAGFGAAVNTGTIGNTLAQDLAAIAVLVCFLGTNDTTANGIALGSPGDPITAATLYGNINAFITGVLTANPAMRLLWVGPYISTNHPLAEVLPVVGAQQSVAGGYGVPVLNMAANSGMNQFNASIMLTDGTHPTPLGFSQLVGPAIADFILANT